MNPMQGTIDGQAMTIGPDGMVRMGSDERMNVLFYKKSVLDPVVSRERGRPWHRAVDYVKIQQPGERDCVDRPVRENDDAIARWPHLWNAYQKQQVQAPNGTPVDLLFPQNPEIPANLHGLGVHTIEQLAGLTEHGAQTIGMGATQWRQKAKEYLAAAAGGGNYHKLQQELDKAHNTIEVMGNQMALMKRQLEQLAAQQNQKISGAMMPPPPSQLAPISFSNDVPSESDALETGLSEIIDPIAEPYTGEPLFVEGGAESEGADTFYAPESQHETSVMEPHRKPGWPKGKPRAPRS
jgi:hypothetical protein